jgi:hypothetical protein
MGGVAKVIGVWSFGEGGTGGGFYGNNLHILFAPQLGSQKGKGNPGKVAAAPGTTHDDVGVIVGHFQLCFGFQANHCLVQQHMV